MCSCVGQRFRTRFCGRSGRARFRTNLFPVCFGLCYMYVQVYKCISVIQVRYNHCEKLRRMDRNNPSHSHRTFGLPPSARGCSVGGQFKSYYLGHPSPSSSPTTMSSQHHSSSPNLVGGHYRVGRKIGEGSFGVIFEGLLFFLSPPLPWPFLQPGLFFSRQGRTFSTLRPSPSNLSVRTRLGARSWFRSPS